MAASLSARMLERAEAQTLASSRSLTPARVLERIVLIALDLVLVNLAFYLAWYARYRMSLFVALDPGNYVGVGTDVLLNIQRLDRVYVDFSISENDLAHLRENMEFPHVDVVNRASSPYGAGWSLAGVEQVVAVSGGVILVNPDGTSLSSPATARVASSRRPATSRP